MIFERESRWRDIPATILAVLHCISCRRQTCLSGGSSGRQLRGSFCNVGAICRVIHRTAVGWLSGDTSVRSFQTTVPMGSNSFHM